jgi:hypothetical protein
VVEEERLVRDRQVHARRITFLDPEEKVPRSQRAGAGGASGALGSGRMRQAGRKRTDRDGDPREPCKPTRGSRAV